MSPKKNEGLVLDGSLSIETAKEVKDRIFEYIKRKKVWQIDLSGVDFLDAAGLQILLALRNYSNSKNTQLVFTGGLQEEFLKSISLFGSEEILSYHQEENDEQ